LEKVKNETPLPQVNVDYSKSYFDKRKKKEDEKS